MNTKKTLELGDVVRFTPRHERHLGTVVEAAVVEITDFHWAPMAGHFTAVAGKTRYGFTLYSHNCEVLKGSADNVEKAEAVYHLLLHKEHGGVWTERYRAHVDAHPEAHGKKAS